MGMLMLPFPMIVLGMIMSMRLCGHGFGHARCWPVLHAYVGQGLTDIRFGCFGSAEFNANSPGGAGLGFDNSRQMSKPVGDRACLAGVGQSFNRPDRKSVVSGKSVSVSVNLGGRRNIKKKKKKIREVHKSKYYKRRLVPMRNGQLKKYV